MKIHWISLLSPLKHVLAQYKSLVVKMHFEYEKRKYAHDNFELFYDPYLILGLPCVMPILEVVYSLIKYAQHWDVFIMNFLDAINLVKAKVFHLYIYPFSSFDDPLFDDFTKVLQQSSDVLLIQLCLNLVEPQAFLGFNMGGQIFVVQTWNLVDGFHMKVHEEDFNKAIIIMKNC